MSKTAEESQPTKEEYLAHRAELFERIRMPEYARPGRPETPVLTAGRLLEVLTQIIAEHGPDVPVFSYAETEWVTRVYWEPFEYKDGSGVNDWHGLSVTLE